MEDTYSKAGALSYASLSIRGTTYEIGFTSVERALGDIKGHVYSDFGCGAGRSTQFLLGLGASHVYAVDNNKWMRDLARSRLPRDVTIVDTIKSMGLPRPIVDGAICLNVLVEVNDRDMMDEI